MDSRNLRLFIKQYSPDCWTLDAGLEIACSGPFLTLLAAPGLGPGGRPRDADPLGAPPILSSLSSPALLSRSPSSAVRLAPWEMKEATLNLFPWQKMAFLGIKTNNTSVWNSFVNVQIWACSSQRRNHRRNPDDGKDSWRAVAGKSSLVCHQNGVNGKNSGMWRTRL